MAQNSLLELKIAGISHLDYQNFLILTGEVFGDAVDRYLYACICTYLLSYYNFVVYANE